MNNKELPMASASFSQSKVIFTNIESKHEKQVTENLDKPIPEVKTEVSGEIKYQGDVASWNVESRKEFDEQLEEVKHSPSQESVFESDIEFKLEESSGEDGGEGEESKVTYIPMQIALTEDEKAAVENHWGFLDFDVVLYTRGDYNYQWLKRGDPIFSVEYARKLYFFLSQANREAFMKRPQYYIKVPLPIKIPPKFKPVPPGMIPAGGLLITSGIAEQLKNLMVELLKNKPKFPFTSLKRSGLLYIAYHLKSRDMTSSPELRAHYRKAMFHMTKTQEAARKLFADVNKYHGRHEQMPEDMKVQLDKFLKLAKLPDNKKLVDPYIEDLEFNYESIIIKDLYDEQDEETMSFLSQNESVQGEELGEAEIMGEDGEPKLEFMGEDGEPKVEVMGEDAEPMKLKLNGKTKKKKNSKKTFKLEEPQIDLDKYSPPAYAGKYRMY